MPDSVLYRNYSWEAFSRRQLFAPPSEETLWPASSRPPNGKLHSYVGTPQEFSVTGSAKMVLDAVAVAPGDQT